MASSRRQTFTSLPFLLRNAAAEVEIQPSDSCSFLRLYFFQSFLLMPIASKPNLSRTLSILLVAAAQLLAAHSRCQAAETSTASNPQSAIQHPKSDTPNALPTIYIAGDSTAAGGTDAARGWARHLAEFFDPANVRIENRARG